MTMERRERLKGLALLLIVAGMPLLLVGALGQAELAGAGVGSIVLAVWLFVWADRQKASVPQLLCDRGQFFDSGGFCFALEPRCPGGVGTLRIWFQTRYASRCRGYVMLRPPFTDAPQRFEIAAPPGAFGHVDFPYPEAIPPMRGLERVVGASFQFEEPRGGALWFADGVPIRGTAPLFGPFEVLAMVLLQTSTRLTVILKYPMPHADEPGQDFTPRILWQPGDDQPGDGQTGSGAPDSER